MKEHKGKDKMDVLHMNAGNGETSYAKNSILQKKVMLKAQPLLEDTLNDMYNEDFPKCFKIADLGCSSGPNTLFVISEIINTIHGLCQQNNSKPPEFQVYLNDLPDNDFNTIFKSLPVFYEKLKKSRGEELSPCFVSGSPGSFYDRLFPTSSLHFVHSSYSVHWLSKVPERLDNNKGNIIYMTKTSNFHVFEAYLKQFQNDFSTFLRLRSEEIIPGGRMVLTFRGRSTADPTSKDSPTLNEILQESLLNMVAEGLIEEAQVDSFNLPIYAPYKDEVKAIIHKEASFTLDRLDTFEVDWDSRDKDDDKHYIFDKQTSGENVARWSRAIWEPILANHFGETVIDELFARFAKHVAEHLSAEKAKIFSIVISLRKK